MKVFLDSSVTIAASISGTGASHDVFLLADHNGWNLLVSPWVLRETRLNLAGKSPHSVATWVTLRPMLTVEDDELTFDWPVVFEASKDKPCFSARSLARTCC